MSTNSTFIQYLRSEKAQKIILDISLRLDESLVAYYKEDPHGYSSKMIVDENQASRIFTQTSRNLETLLDIPTPKDKPKISYLSPQSSNPIIHYLHSSKDFLRVQTTTAVFGTATIAAMVAVFDPLQSILAGSIGMMLSIHNLASSGGRYFAHSIFLRLSQKERFAHVASHEYAHFLQAHLCKKTSGLQNLYHNISTPSFISEGFAETCAHESLSLMEGSFKKYALLEKQICLEHVLADGNINHYHYGATLMHLAIEKHGKGVLKEIARGEYGSLLAD